MNNFKNKNVIIPLVAAIVIIIIAIVIHASTKAPVVPTDTSSNANPAATSTQAVPNASNATLSPTAPNSSKPVLTTMPENMYYTVMTDKASYTQNEQINITLSVTNNTKEPKTYSFKNGCQGTYTIADFDLAKHIDCRTGATAFVVQPKETKQIKLVHYPALAKLPVGKQTLAASIIGYEGAGANVAVTITGSAAPAVASTTAPMITIVSPNGGDRWMMGTDNNAVNYTVKLSVKNAAPGKTYGVFMSLVDMNGQNTFFAQDSVIAGENTIIVKNPVKLNSNQYSPLKAGQYKLSATLADSLLCEASTPCPKTSLSEDMSDAFFTITPQ